MAGDRRCREGHASDCGEDPARNPSRLANSCSRFNAAARTVIPASPPIRRSASRPTCWCVTAERPSSPRRRRSMEPNTCSHAAPRRREVGEKLISRIKWWEDYTARNGGEMNNNPSPGNKAGGLTTILEKSLARQPRADARHFAPSTNMPSRSARLRLHGYARLRSRGGDRSGRGRRQFDRPSPPAVARPSAASPCRP